MFTHNLVRTKDQRLWPYAQHKAYEFLSLSLGQYWHGKEFHAEFNYTTDGVNMMPMKQSLLYGQYFFMST